MIGELTEGALEGRRYAGPIVARTPVQSGTPTAAREGARLQFIAFDAAYLERLQRGDAGTERHFVAYFGELIRLKLRSRLNSREAVEDVRQETFVRVYQHRNSFNFQHCFSTWIYTICLNLARNELRKRKKFKFYEISDMQGHEAEFAVEMKLPSRLPQAINAAINDLPEKYKTAFVLRDVEEMPYEEVAAVLGVPLGTVKSRVNRARLILRDKLQPRLEEQHALSKSTLLPVSIL